MGEYLDPNTLTPEKLYSLQSETWSQGYDHGVDEERERWRSWLARVRTWNPTKMMDFVEGGLYSQDRIMRILRNELDSIQKKINDSVNGPVDFAWQGDMELIEKLISLIEKSE